MSTATATRPRVLSGMRPTGQLHVGHLLGALGNWVRMQDDYECIYMVADLHALTTGYEDVQGIRANGIEMVADWVAAGVDPQRSIIFRQSDVPQHAELAQLLGMITPLSWLERVPTYKGQIDELGEHLLTYGFLGYPLLQTADIILYKATRVPVGQDQLPHLELSREVVRRFNHLYGPVFPEPEAIISEAPLLLGMDGRKMSKSYGNAITLASSDEEIDKQVMSMVTDPQRIKKDDPGNPEICNVFAWQKFLGASDAEIADIFEGCTSATLGCVADKRDLAERVKGLIRPIREKREHLMDDPAKLEAILEEGAERARAIAGPVMAEATAAMGL
ncbi:MAG: tryptophan--tRNA ligase [Miltoncostaeaceae bacterium]